MAAAPALAAAGRPVRLGGPIYLKSTDPRELAREHRRLGYSAAYCPGIKIDDAKATRDAYAAENVVIAEVGAWKNMLDPDDEVRKANVAYVIERLALAEAVGARCCVDIAGSYNPKVWYGPHPKNLSKEFFDATVENCRKVIDQVKPTKTTFSIEMMGWAIPDGPDSYVSLIKAVDRKAFSVHMDICNGINSPERFYRNREYIEDCFKKLGRWITSCHAKDLQWLFTNHRIAAHPREHVLDGLFRFAQVLGVHEKTLRWDIPIPEAARTFAQQHLPGEQATLIISPCSSARLRNWRNWSAQRYAQVVDYAVERHGMRVLLTGGPTPLEREVGAQIMQQARHAPHNLIGQTNLKQLLALLQLGTVLISPDSGPAHMATCVGTPVIGLYATSNPLRTGPYLSQRWVVSKYSEALGADGKSVDAVSWGRRVRSPDAMDLITVAEVIAKLDELMRSR